jgi:hypothetical protein
LIGKANIALSEKPHTVPSPAECVACGVQFIPGRRKRYCSKACRLAPAPAVYRFLAPDGRSYVGSRADCRRREREGIGPNNNRLRAALAIYSADSWTFEILQVLPAGCSDQIRLRAEQHHIDRLRSWDPACGFNIIPANCDAASFQRREANRRRMSVITTAIRANWYSRRAEWVNARVSQNGNGEIDALAELRDAPKAADAVGKPALTSRGDSAETKLGPP